MTNPESYAAALESFVADGWITGVDGVLKSGKEGTVYRCRAVPATGREFLAAKVYRPREHRTFKNDAIYHEGRGLGVGFGGPEGAAGALGRPDRRLQRAFAKKTRAGRAGQYASWVLHEYHTLGLLHAAGAAVPTPFARTESAILMEYIGDADAAAPLLQHVPLGEDEAAALFRDLLRDIELWLARGRIHADLSPFNILYWRGRVTVIDFPQAVDPVANPQALTLLTRDVENVCRFFARFGVRADGAALAYSLWDKFVQMAW